MYRVIDIETENTGTDIMADNKRIISVQIGDDAKQNLWWADSKNPQWNLESVKGEVDSLLSQGVIFAGHNVKGFDIRFLKEFLGVEIPESNIHDPCECQREKMTQLTGRNYPTLEEACTVFGIKVAHKQRMNEKTQLYKNRPEFQEKAKEAAKKILKAKPNWTLNYAYDRALNKIAGGNAIYDSYLDFVKSGGLKNTLFYEYAIGDVISEYQLLKKLEY